MEKFPKQLFIQRIDNNPEAYFEAAAAIDDLDEDVEEVAVYALMEVKKFVVTKELK